MDLYPSSLKMAFISIACTALLNCGAVATIDSNQNHPFNPPSTQPDNPVQNPISPTPNITPTPNPSPSPPPSPNPTCQNFTMPNILPGGMDLHINNDQAPFSLPGGSVYSENLAYDNKQRTRMDIFLPQSMQATPVVIYIHGGGFTGGDKNSAVLETMLETEGFIQSLLNQNIAFIRANYSFLNSSDNTHGVYGSLQDIRRLVQFIRYHHQSLNIHPAKIGMIGNSAGAGAISWIALHDDMMNSTSSDPVEHMPTTIQAAVAMHGQASYDLMQWESIFPGLDLQWLYNNSLDIQQTIHAFYHINDYSQMFNQPTLGQRQDLDFLSMADTCDPPIQLINLSPHSTTIPWSINALNHHPNHAYALYQALKAQNNPTVQARIPAMNIEEPRSIASPFDFFMQTL